MKNGFTIIELMLTILVMAVALTIGTPSFLSSLQNNRITSQSNAMIGAISYARSEAVKLNDQAVTMCGSSNLTSCNTNNWEQGWIIFADTDRNGNRNGAETILRVGEALTGNNTLRLNGFASAASIRFDSQGSVANSGTFIFCDDRDEDFAKAIVMNVSGQTRPAQDENTPEDSIVNAHDGGNVSCP
jgi:type IV fimbrial biogenesis protein FimT